MKKSLLLFSSLLLLINTTAGVIFSSYNSFNVGLSDFSILLTSILIYLSYHTRRIADGFKIGFTIFFSLTGLGRFTCALVSSEKINGNIAIFIFMIILAIELVSLLTASTLKDK